APGSLRPTLFPCTPLFRYDAGWKFVTGREPPARPYDPGVTRGELVAWITVSAAATTIARLLADRSAARRWQAWTGVLPPDVDGRSEEHTSELQSRENLVCR